MARKIRAGFALVALAVTLVVGFGASPASAQPSWCGWRPANNHNVEVSIPYVNVPLRTGQSDMCDRILTTSPGDKVVVHCATLNGSNEAWLYVQHKRSGRLGWVSYRNAPDAPTNVRC